MPALAITKTLVKNNSSNKLYLKSQPTQFVFLLTKLAQDSVGTGVFVQLFGAVYHDGITGMLPNKCC